MAETWRTERSSLLLSLSCYTLVFSLAEPRPALLSATWAVQRTQHLESNPSRRSDDGEGDE